MTDVLVIGAGPAGLVAALRAGDLGVRTTLVTRDELGGMAANDGPVPVRTLAHAARLLREARQLAQYGIAVSDPALDYPRLLARVHDVVANVREHAALRPQLDTARVTLIEHAGAVRFVDPHTIEAADGRRLSADKIILCTGGASRRLAVPGAELTATHSDAWSLSAVPPSMIVVGGGATGVQVASIFHAFGTNVQLFQAAPRLLTSEDDDVSIAVTLAFRAAGIAVHEDFGTIDRFDKTPSGVQMTFSKDGVQRAAEAALVVMAIGWVANTAGLNLPIAGIEVDRRAFVRVDPYLRTTAPHIYAAGDVTGRLMLVPQAMQAGFTAATNAVQGPAVAVREPVNPIGSFTDPEYAQVGLTERKARETRDVIAVTIPFDATTRTIIDGRTDGFCKLVVDRASATIAGCHVVGDRAVEIVQVAAIAMAGSVRVDTLARIPLSFPTYTGILGRAAATAARQLRLDVRPLAETT
jgi:pyruvate/2-oxoglutarate dehydrogenase complex dihydrolipoamide dehydrogenase (E3) component